MSKYTIATFYKFTVLNELTKLQKELKAQCETQSILGTIFLSKEGINATIVGIDTNIKTIISFIKKYPYFADMECKYSSADSLPFRKMKITIKKEIVTFKNPEINPIEKTGTPVEPKDWNELINDPDVLVIDTRNTYEIELGTFINAINPETEKFTDFPEFVERNLNPTQHKKIAMFCTGGIRCEKASSFLLHKGFAEVYQLKGGILKYLEQIPHEESLWQGDCFIFDDRVLVDKESIKKEI